MLIINKLIHELSNKIASFKKISEYFDLSVRETRDQLKEIWQVLERAQQ